MTDDDDLVSLARKHGSEKWGTHDFAAIYHEHLAKFRPFAINVLEIGVGGYADPAAGGASLRMWEEYFPLASIWSLDIYAKTLSFGPRVSIVQGDQADVATLRALIAQAGEFDVVIDDGSHLNPQVLSTLDTIFPAVRNGGIYAIECTQTSYWPRYGGDSNELNRPDTIMGRLKSLADGLNYQERIAPGYVPSSFDQSVSALHFYNNLAIIEKGPNLQPSAVLLGNQPRPGCEDIAIGGSPAPLARYDIGADLLRAFSMKQMAPWQATVLTSEALDARLHAISLEASNVFVFDVAQDGTRVRKKPAIEQLLAAGHQLEVVRRADIYRQLFNEVCARHGFSGSVTLAIDVGDEAPEHTDVPVCSFQRVVGEMTPLLPDFEIISLAYLEAVVADPFPFAEKVCKASFAGSTTGKAVITMDDLLNDAVPRIRAAQFFKAVPEVEFSLTNLVQFEDPAVGEALRAAGFGGARIGWEETFSSKFLISIDGNGAPCSRPAIALRSNSALIKYDSNNELFYTSGLVPWLHYLPVATDQAVLDLVQREAEQPGLFEGVARAGSEFARMTLNRTAILDYTAGLLAEYKRLFYRD